MQAGRPWNALLYYALYLAFLVLVLVLLLNLLIAMMGRTYQATMDTATLQWRLKFARLVLRLELLASNTPFALVFGKAARNPTVWPCHLSSRAARRMSARSYLGRSFVFRTYSEYAASSEQSLMLTDDRGDPFKGSEVKGPLTAAQGADILRKLMELKGTVDDNAAQAGGGGSGVAGARPPALDAAGGGGASTAAKSNSVGSPTFLGVLAEAKAKREADDLTRPHAGGGANGGASGEASGGGGKAMGGENKRVVIAGVEKPMVPPDAADVTAVPSHRAPPPMHAGTAQGGTAGSVAADPVPAILSRPCTAQRPRQQVGGRGWKQQGSPRSPARSFPGAAASRPALPPIVADGGTVTSLAGTPERRAAQRSARLTVEGESMPSPSFNF